MPHNEFGKRIAVTLVPMTMRLPGSVAEVEASPRGPKVGAFFDLDGTLVAGFTGVMMTQDRLRRRQMGVGEFIGMVQAGLNHQLGRSEFEDLIGKRRQDVARQFARRRRRTRRAAVRAEDRSRIYPEMRELVRAHMARGHTVVLSSSALTVQVEPVARFLGIDNVLSNKFETDEDGLITGEVRQARSSGGPARPGPCRSSPPSNDVDLPRATSTPTATRTSR